ncbi:MAG: PIN domain-containing protein [Actinobacteria bacterium]|jgi:predicted nucleic-acid-binding protein|nr:PIN domain-containing protein [Actinomycetota bacterium]
MIFLDTNIFLRYFLKENESVFRRLEKLFSEIILGNIIGVANAMIIAEVVWVLSRSYKWNKEKICDNIEFILITPNIRFKDKAILVNAVNVYKEKNISFIDAYNYSFIRANGVTEIYSFDRDFDELQDVKRLEP